MIGDISCVLAGMLVVKIGGPAYRIGVGGGAASSIQVTSLTLGAHGYLVLVVNFPRPKEFFFFFCEHDKLKTNVIPLTGLTE